MPFLPKWHTKVKHWSLFVSFSHCCNLCMYMIYCHTMIFLNRCSKMKYSRENHWGCKSPPPPHEVTYWKVFQYLTCLFHQIEQFECMCGSIKIALAGQFQLKYTEYTRILHNTGVFTPSCIDTKTKTPRIRGKLINIQCWIWIWICQRCAYSERWNNCL